MKKIFSDIETPAFIVKPDVLLESIETFQGALNEYFPNNILSYSVKTNSFPYVLKVIKQQGGFAEVVSKDEYELALKCGFDERNIVYNGPLKSKETFLSAIQAGAIVNIECGREIDWLADLPKDKLFPIGLRVNIDLGDISPEDAKANEAYSRFGFSYSSGDLDRGINKIRALSNVYIDCLHVHRTTASRSVSVFNKISRFILKVIDKYQLNSITKIDIGGGFYGIMTGKPSFREYCAAIYEGLVGCVDLDRVTLIVEPGNAIVASAFDFVSSVIDVKRVRDFYICTTDGSRNDIDPFYRKDSYYYEIMRKTVVDTSEVSKIKKQVIAGGTCLEYDKLFMIEGQPCLNVGDLIIYKSVGAYTMTLSPLFIRLFPHVYLKTDEGYSLIRKKWSSEDIFEMFEIIL